MSRVLVGEAAWLDEASGVREEALYLGSPGDRVIVMAYVPPSASTAVLWCSAPARHLLSRYRFEVMIARRLAASGVAVARFHYRGAGNSESVRYGTQTLRTMDVDAALVADWIRTGLGIERLAFSGTSLACFTAARAASTSERSPLVLLNPVVNVNSFYRQLWRTRRVAETRNGMHAPEGIGFEKTIRRDGLVDLLGYSITEDAYESALERDLAAEIVGGPRCILVAQVDNRETLKSELASFADQLRAAGHSVEAAAVKERAWWFIPDEEHADESEREDEELTAAIAPWLLEALEEWA